MIAHETELRILPSEARILGARNIIKPKVIMKRKLSLIHLNERSRITMNGNFELFNISHESFNISFNISLEIFKVILHRTIFHDGF